MRLYLQRDGGGETVGDGKEIVVGRRKVSGARSARMVF